MIHRRSVPYAGYAALVLITLGVFAIGNTVPCMVNAAGISLIDETPPATTPVTGTWYVYFPLVNKPKPWVPYEITNPGFEVPWEHDSSNECLIFRTDGTIEQATPTEIRTPPGWLTWFKQGLPVDHDPSNLIGWGQPEVGEARHTDPDRMHSGEQGIKLFTMWRVHDAGFIQQIVVTPTQEIRLDGWAHAWSNNDDDPACSEGGSVGCDPFFALEGTEGLDDGDRNFTFRLGIDPTGGTNPYADTVVWGQGAHIYNAFFQVPTVTTTAESPTVTLFLRSRTLWPFKHNDAYWDDISVDVR